MTHINLDGFYITTLPSPKQLYLDGETSYIGAQNGILTDSSMAGHTLGAQTEQAYRNTLEILKTVDASQGNVVQQTMYVVKVQGIRGGYAITQRAWEDFPTAISLVFI